MVQPQCGQFELFERHFFIRRRFEHRTVLGWESSQQRQASHVEQQSAQRVLIDTLGRHFFGNDRRGRTLHERPLPVVAVVGQTGGFVCVSFDKAEIECQGAGHRRTQNRRGLLDTGNIVTDAEIGGVCRTDDPRRHRGIGQNRLHDLTLLDDRFLRQLQQSHGDCRQRRQLGHGPDFRRVNHRA